MISGSMYKVTIILLLGDIAMPASDTLISIASWQLTLSKVAKIHVATGNINDAKPYTIKSGSYNTLHGCHGYYLFYLLRSKVWHTYSDISITGPTQIRIAMVCIVFLCYVHCTVMLRSYQGVIPLHIHTMHDNSCDL